MSYGIPKPSICDGCRYAYFLTTGVMQFGSWDSLSYMQRYCAVMPKSLHMGGVDACSRMVVNWKWDRTDDPNELLKIEVEEELRQWQAGRFEKGG